MTSEEMRSYIKDAMASQDVSQAELARRSGLTSATINRYFSKKRELSVNSLLLICDALELTVEVI